MILRALVASAVLFCVGSATAADPRRAPSTTFTVADVFAMEWAAGPAIAPDGSRVAYVRVSGDVMKDRFRRSIWLVDANGQNHRPLVQGAGSYSSPVWSPDGRAIAYTANEQTGAEVRVFYLDTRQSALLARLPSGAQNLTWSPDGRALAFQSFVKEKPRDAAGMPPKPDGAEWAPPARVVDTLVYRVDGNGFLDAGFTQIFVLPADGGSPRQLTWAARNHDGRLSWSRDASKLYFAANAEENWQTAPLESDVYALAIADGAITRLTTRKGPDAEPTLSPDGARIAYVGFDDREQGYQVSELWVADANGANPRSLTARFDRDIARPEWTRDGRAIVFLYEDHGKTYVGRVSVNGGAVTTLMRDIGGMDPGRPYTSGAFSLARNGAIAATVGSAQQPANIAVSTGGGAARQLTRLNDDLFAGKTIPDATLLTAKSSADGRDIEAWVVRPPNFDASKKYPMLLEIHGGPFTAYGPNWSAEAQLFAAAGYIVVYANPRGSTSYGGAFGNLIHHAYPSKDYDDLMSVVDAAIAREPIDATKLFVTGGSGGGVLTAWIVGTTDRFAAAMVQKPVINWTSFVLTGDMTNFFYRYWFPGPPWEHQDQYWKRSPLSRVGNVKTPTAVLSGEADLRTPISEAEQYYTALRMRNVPTRLIRVPGAFHDLAARPSGLVAKVNNTVAWFAEYGGPKVPEN